MPNIRNNLIKKNRKNQFSFWSILDFTRCGQQSGHFFFESLFKTSRYDILQGLFYSLHARTSRFQLLLYRQLADLLFVLPFLPLSLSFLRMSHLNWFLPEIYCSGCFSRLFIHRFDFFRIGSVWCGLLLIFLRLSFISLFFPLLNKFFLRFVTAFDSSRFFHVL